MIARYILAWFPMILIAIANGVLREFTYGKALGELRAHQLSTVLGIVFLGLYIWAVTRFWPLESGAQALAVGGVWLVLTVAFEFLFGHYVAGHPWRKLRADYNLLAGRLWGLLLLWVALAPYLFYRLHHAG